MSDTLRFQMPLLDAAQAQKHVTVNEALLRADVLAAGRVETVGESAPPPAPSDAEAHVVGTAATGAWSGHDTAVALWLNGGWVFLTPWSGLTLWDDRTRSNVTYLGETWTTGVLAGSGGGAATYGRVIEADHTLATGPTSTTAAIIPDKAIVIGVTARVTTALAGVTGWSLGVAGSADRYGTGYGVGVGAFAHGVTGSPQAYYGATSLLLSAEGGSFSAGAVRVAVHYLDLAPPA